MSKSRLVAYCAVMTALALALSYIERFIPIQLLIPLPGIKLGLANIVMLVAIYLLKTRYAFMILILRCLLGAIFGGGFTALCFSLLGGILALAVMAAAGKTGLFSVYGVSVLGAATHQIGQIIAAMILMNSVYIGAYLPYLLAASIVTGLLTGTVCAGILRILAKTENYPNEDR